MSTLLLLLLLAQSIEPPFRGGIAVEAVDGRGKPVADARITVVEPLLEGAFLRAAPLVEVEQRGRTWQCDQEGRAEVAVATADSLLLARDPAGARWSLRSIASWQGEPRLRFVLGPAADHHVAVYDSTGHPARAPLLQFEASAAGNSERDSERVVRWSTPAGRDGSWTLPAADRLALAALAGLDEADVDGKRLRVVAGAARARSTRRGPDATRLDLDPTRRLEIELRRKDGTRAEVDGVARLRLYHRGARRSDFLDDADPGSAPPAPLAAAMFVELPVVAGCAALDPFDAIGRIEVEATSGARRWWSDGDFTDAEGRGTGPLALTLWEMPSVLGLRARALDGAQRPLADRELRLLARFDQETVVAGSVRSDADGRLFVPHEMATRKLPIGSTVLEAVALEIDVAGGGVLAVELPVRTFLGQADAGDLLFARSDPAIALEGKVVDEHGDPLPGIAIRAVALEPFPPPEGEAPAREPARRPVGSGGRALTASDGSFALRGDYAAGSRLLLRLSEARFATDVPLEWPAGDRNARIELRRHGSLLGALRLADGVDPATITVHVGDHHSMLAHRGELATFEFPSLVAGRYQLRVFHHGPADEFEEIATVGAIDVAPGAVTRDPRLAPLDLRDALTLTALRIVDLEGQPIAVGLVSFGEESLRRSTRKDEVALSLLDQPLKTQPFVDGRCLVVHHGLLPEVTVRARGYRTRVVEATRATEPIELAPGLPLRLHFSTAGLPEGYEWSATASVRIVDESDDPVQRLEARAEGFHRPFERARNPLARTTAEPLRLDGETLFLFGAPVTVELRVVLSYREKRASGAEAATEPAATEPATEPATTDAGEALPAARREALPAEPSSPRSTGIFLLPRRRITIDDRRDGPAFRIELDERLLAKLRRQIADGASEFSEWLGADE
ncbi:MAG: hypothetical protein JNL90_15930 [Planctomycetes bacterium]|nr:hypothetical protein [Planctomycetota bacterium]